MSTRFPIIAAVVAVLAASLWPPVEARARLTAPESCESAIAAFSDADLVYLGTLPEPPGDPDGDREWLTRFRDLSGKDYQPNDLERLRRASACLHGDIGDTSPVDVPTLPPTPAPMANSVGDRACRQFADGWLSGTEATGIRLSAADVVALTSCRQARDGTWFLPVTPDDPRLPVPILTAEQARQTAGLRSDLLAQLEGLNAWLPTWMQPLLAALYTATYHPATGHLNPDVGTGGFQDQYRDVLLAYLNDPNHLALGRYAWWWAGRREPIAARLCQDHQLPPPVCSWLWAQLGNVGWAPWPWDLEDPITLATHLAWALDNGIVAAPPPTPTTPTAPDACAERAFWMGATVQRVRTAQDLLNQVGMPPTLPNAGLATVLADDAASMTRLALDQEQSAPPASVLALNALLVQAFRGYAASYATLADAATTGDDAAWERGWVERADADRYLAEAISVIAQLEAECGRTFGP